MKAASKSEILHFFMRRNFPFSHMELITIPSLGLGSSQYLDIAKMPSLGIM